MSGNVATVILAGLVAGKSYDLFVLFTFSDGSALETRTVIKCPG